MLRLFDRLYLVCIWISGISIFVMSLIIPWGVFARYVLGTGSSWPEPVAVLLMVTFTFMGAAASYRAGAHIAVGMLTDHLPQPLQKKCATLVHFLMAGICIFVIVWGSKLSLQTMGQTLADLPWMAVGWTYMPLPLGALLTLVFVVEVLFWGPAHQRAVVVFDHEGPASVEAV
ncbi:TRAP transporter small permease [Limnohabitans sp.]|uniref:TRAP transporter small permease n=1 Tax=Limnohabitans sp. TaxID=1907725 RepID=UPI0039BC489E|nr:TRAP transporter small permease [Comamonadaceae bacterium]